MSIAYAIGSEQTEKLAAELFYALAKRDYILSIGDIQVFERYTKHVGKDQNILPSGLGSDLN